MNFRSSEVSSSPRSLNCNCVAIVLCNCKVTMLSKLYAIVNSRSSEVSSSTRFLNYLKHLFKPTSNIAPKLKISSQKVDAKYLCHYGSTAERKPKQITNHFLWYCEFYFILLKYTTISWFNLFFIILQFIVFSSQTVIITFLFNVWFSLF